METAAEVPREFGKNLCACGSCRLVKTFQQFLENGCENCPFLGMEGDRERVSDCTTVNFAGMIAVVDPPASWAAKWLHCSKFAPGCYALSVQSELPQHIEDILDDNNITWHKRAD
ncbi:hypothetical protein WJX72_010935 [[Myrmecia] bisecta]|uniref:Transcription elongation factor SPT4 homolog n=1 Tax=[Myrmecia] bisecta TaxID=41462 RepID=A0AAW1PB23_9CHLO